MRTDLTATCTTPSAIVSPIKRLMRVGGVALAMTLTLGIAVAVSGHPAEASSGHTRSVSQSPLPLQASAKVVEATTSTQPELMHDAPTVELTSAVASPDAAKPAATSSRTIKMIVTAYCPCAKCCGENASGVTASGKLVSYNAGRFVAADPSLAFGTKLIIPGYESSPVEVLDRGGAIRGNHIDVFFPTHQQALDWGRRLVEVTVLE
jgi:3D (Asp-Asp-Asp) domain-containing protein